MSYIDLIKKAAGFLKEEKYPPAIAILERCLAVNLHDPMVLYLLGTAYQRQRFLGTAISHLARATDIKPDMDMAWHQLGVCLRQMEYYDQARDAYLKALDLKPDRADTMAMLAGAHVNVGDPEPGEEWARKSLELEDTPEAWLNLGFCLLEQGKWEEGWKAYEYRWDAPERIKDKRNYGDVPKWDGKPLDGTLIIHGEQGLGDEILFMSLFDEVRAEHVLVECAPRLIPLFERSFGVRCYGTHQELMDGLLPMDEIKAWLPMGDLPRLYRNIDASFDRQKPFLIPDSEKVEKWRTKLEKQGPGPYVGLAWFGGNQKTHQYLRCVPLEQWGPILEQDCTFVSVQYGVKKTPILHWQEAVDDLDELTALIQACDLIITVPQTAVHQAAAMGKPCWVLTPKGTSWQFSTGGERMVWYPSVKQFRQTNGWDEVIERIGSELGAYLRKVSGAKPKAA